MRLLTVALAACATYAYLATLELSDLRADVRVMVYARIRLIRQMAALRRRIERLEHSARIDRELERSRDRLLGMMRDEKAAACEKEPPRYTLPAVLKLAGLKDAK
ncbi:hypothetical protein [Deinococcus humi]|uniref:Uncharacterized protein n=1 Tax=Deinococcus humi TaxID=662880 RepID=A0A7W8JT73_9DEIO|nr:hypothetical protein [Deinococcus humi]MBB5361361.1 hypothetical protein [Deinococcus humi]GGO19654.1 hypothetical protein GCM10008949_04230 [Deinococcus humi]